METARTLRIPLNNLRCGEATAVEHVLAAIGGVLRVYVNPVTETAYLEYDPFQTDPRALRRAMQRAGYRAGPPAA